MGVNLLGKMKIHEIAKKIGVKEDYLEQYGKYKAKISNELLEKKKNDI